MIDTNKALTDWSEDDNFLGCEMEDSFSMLPQDASKQEVYLKALRSILPYLGSNETKIIVTEIVIALKLEGLVGKELTARENSMINTLKEAILSEPIRRRQAITLAQRLLGEEKTDQSHAN